MPASDEGFCPRCKHPIYDGIKHDCAAWSQPAMLDCPECETPAIPASSVIGGRPAWTEDDAEVWCPGCGCLLHVFLTGDCQGSQWCEARVSEYSGRDWRRAIEGALGVDEVPDEHTPDFMAEAVLAQREIGNKRICQDERDVLGSAFAIAHSWHISNGVEPLEAAERALTQARECVDAYRYALTQEFDNATDEA